MLGYSYEDRRVNADLEPLAGTVALRSLMISGPAITDDGLRHLRGLTQLEELNLTRTPITDKGLVHLEKLKALRKLGVYKSSVTQAGAGRLKAAIPGLIINGLDE